MKGTLSVFICSILLNFSHALYPVAAATSLLGPVVDLGYAAYAGNTTSPAGVLNSSVTFFGGIPYAQPPMGELRFRAPQMLDETVPGHGTNITIAEARNFALPCIQQPAKLGVGSEGE